MERTYKGAMTIRNERLIKDGRPISLPDLLIWAQENESADTDYVADVKRIVTRMHEHYSVFVMPAIRQSIRDAKIEQKRDLVVGALAEEMFAKWESAYAEFQIATAERGLYRWIAQLDFLWVNAPTDTLVQWEYLQQVPADVNFD